MAEVMHEVQSVLAETTAKPAAMINSQLRRPMLCCSPTAVQEQACRTSAGARLWPDPSGVLPKVGIKSDMGVIDLCSGDGWFTLQIARLAGRDVATDVDPALLETARHRLTFAGNGHPVVHTT